jgi:hypothetical protein
LEWALEIVRELSELDITFQAVEQTFDLSQHQAVGGFPGPDNVDGLFAYPFVMRTAQHFLIDRNTCPPITSLAALIQFRKPAWNCSGSKTPW